MEQLEITDLIPVDIAEQNNLLSPIEEEKTLETIQNLQEDAIKNFRLKAQAFTKLLNQRPAPEKIKSHQGYDYLPISVIEKDLDKLFFGLVQYECIGYQQIFNEISCHARIKVFHPVINQWFNYDGVGSAVIQQDANTKVIDFHQFKKPNALQLTLPKAYAEAIKNAAKKIGKRFGADINRKFEDNYEPMIPTTEIKPKVKITKGSPAWIQIVNELKRGILLTDIEQKVELTDEQREQLQEEAL